MWRDDRGEGRDARASRGQSLQPELRGGDGRAPSRAVSPSSRGPVSSCLASGPEPLPGPAQALDRTGTWEMRFAGNQYVLQGPELGSDATARAVSPGSHLGGEIAGAQAS